MGWVDQKKTKWGGWPKKQVKYLHTSAMDQLMILTTNALGYGDKNITNKTIILLGAKKYKLHLVENGLSESIGIDWGSDRVTSIKDYIKN